VPTVISAAGPGAEGMDKGRIKGSMGMDLDEDDEDDEVRFLTFRIFFLEKFAHGFMEYS
jgi:hypothetical protein